ncbi:MAG TPA: GNAT family N-acetyltransferase [Candidatus Cybelea sp.]|nr:GNAT family N-acetyltransferase [Candidatus Cybelea sp.]
MTSIQPRATIPVLETPRLRLRGHRRDDLRACVAMWSDPIVTKYISGRASTEQQTWSRICTYIGHWALLGFGYWAIEEKGSNEFVGEAGLADFKRDVSASLRGRPELGFAIVPRAHGKGYATEAARAALSWADANVAQPTSFCLINPQNAASRRVAEKCGYEILEESLYNGEPVLFYTRSIGGGFQRPSSA